MLLIVQCKKERLKGKRKAVNEMIVDYGMTIRQVILSWFKYFSARRGILEGKRMTNMMMV